MPMFFISGTADPTKLSYASDELKKHDTDYDLSFQIKNRLYDRDALLLSHYDLNFLYVLSLYARDNAGAKSKWRESVRGKFRKAVQEMLKTKYEFYALAAHPDVDAEAYFKSHFQETLGKTFRPFANQGIFSLALDKQYPADNAKLTERLRENFFVKDYALGEEDPEKVLADEIEKLQREGLGRSSNHQGLAFVAYIPDAEAYNYENLLASEYRYRGLPTGNIQEISYLIPVIRGRINGFYEIKGINLSVSPKDGKPRTVFERGDFHKLGGQKVAVQKPATLKPKLYYSESVPLHIIKEIYSNSN